MKDIGLVGLPHSGKSTLFTALTKTGGVGGRANQAVVSVPDARLSVLAEMERSKRVVAAQVRFIDAPGGASARAMALLRETDALCLVLRAFGPNADPVAELAEIRTELILADLGVVEGALENARRRSKGRAPQSTGEVEVLERAHAALSEETLAREMPLDDGERRHLRGLSLLTEKPWVPVANLDEGAEPWSEDEPALVSVWAAIEAETAGMVADEAKSLLVEFGVAEPGLDRVVSACYRALDLITFLTTGPDETRAWEVRRGATAPDAAGVIHSDLQRGFIRAEVVSFDDLVASGGWDAAKARGLLRVEGRDYVVREGDVLHVRFSV